MYLHEYFVEERAFLPYMFVKNKYSLWFRIDGFTGSPDFKKSSEAKQFRTQQCIVIINAISGILRYRSYFDNRLSIVFENNPFRIDGRGGVHEALAKGRGVKWPGDAGLKQNTIVKCSYDKSIFLLCSRFKVLYGVCAKVHTRGGFET